MAANRDDLFSQLSLFMGLFPLFMQSLPPAPEPEVEPIDPLALQHAGEMAVADLYYEIQSLSQNYDVPGDLLWALVVDWIVSDQMCSQRTPAEFLIPEGQRANLSMPRPYSVPPLSEGNSQGPSPARPETTAIKRTQSGTVQHELAFSECIPVG